MATPKQKKVLVGMSGGVDSSVTAALLVEQGYEVIGAFMKNWSGTVHGPEEKSADRVDDAYEECGWKTERRDAARVAAKLGIPFTTLDFEAQYREDVLEYLFRETKAGRTPNPDVMCNRYIKFDRFVQAADQLGCDYVATGHYARVQGGKIYKGLDDNKDQTYFLWAINPAVLERTLFPIGEMKKPEVRKKAEALGLDVAQKKDSTGICFVGDVEMRSFLQERLSKEPGPIVSTDREVLGEHEGINFYTIGQRHGLGIGGGPPRYVVEKRPETNELVVGGEFDPALFKTELKATDLNWFEEIKAPFTCEARHRYRQPVQTCTIDSIEDGRAHVRFDQPQRAITPGQSIVFYLGDQMLGGGIIK